MKIKNIILGRYNEIQTEIWVGVAYFWPKLDSTQVPKYRVVAGGSQIYKSLKCSIVGPVSATWYPIPRQSWREAPRYPRNGGPRGRPQAGLGGALPPDFFLEFMKIERIFIFWLN